MYAPRLKLGLALTGALISLTILPAVAEAHGGSSQPVATNYLAKVTGAPHGLDAKVVDGDLRLWLSVPAQATVVVLDYRGAPYLRFDRSGVQVNHNSAMYYLNQTPVAETPPAGLNRSTPPDWATVSSSHAYTWHDGRLHALAAVALTPGTSYVGQWSIPIKVNGHPAAIVGGVWHADRPSIVWFWPILVLIACVIALGRIKRPTLTARLARVLGTTALIALAAAGAGRELHGHPFVSTFQCIELGVILAFVAWGLIRVLFQEPGYFTYFLISLAALWEGVAVIAVLRDGFVLIDLPSLIARIAAVLCLGCGAATLTLVFHLAEPPERGRKAKSSSTSDETEPDTLRQAPHAG